MNIKRIVQVSAYYPPHLGGQENAVQGLARQLAWRGHDVRVLTSTQGGGRKGTTIEEKVRVQRMAGFVFGHAPIMPWFPIALFRSTRADSIVHVHIGQAFTPEIVWLVSKLRRFRYVAQLHIDFEPSGPAGILLPLYKRLVLKRVLQSASCIVTLNQKTLRTVRKTYGLTSETRVMNNGIDETYFALHRAPFAPRPPRVLRLLFVGRLSKQKNIPTLLKALTITAQNVHVDIVGEGTEHELIKRLIVQHGLDNVVLRGRLGRAEVMQCYQTADALVVPSFYEAQPLVLLEAMAARVPIIGTNVIGVAEHIKNAGIIVEPTSEGLAAGIERYFSDYALLPHLVKHGYDKANKLRWPKIVKKYEELYEEVAAV